MDPDKIFGIDMGELSPYSNDWDGMFDRSKLEVSTLEDVNERKVRRFLKGLDVVWGAETLYSNLVTDLALEMGVKTCVQGNFEFMGYLADPRIPRPDLFLSPSTWHLEEWPANTLYLPFPVDRKRLPFRKRNEARTFLHIAGHRAMRDRNGTRLVLAAARYVRTEVEIVIRTQSQVGTAVPHPKSLARIRVEKANVKDYWSLYDEGDVLLAPRRYGGQSLPMNEALSKGMPVISLDAEPQKRFLPPECLVPAKVHTMKVQPGIVEWYDGHPRDLASYIDEFAAFPGLVQQMSTAADKHAETISWDALKPVYLQVFEELAAGKDVSSARAVG